MTLFTNNTQIDPFIPTQDYDLQEPDDSFFNSEKDKYEKVKDEVAFGDLGKFPFMPSPPPKVKRVDSVRSQSQSSAARSQGSGTSNTTIYTFNSDKNQINFTHTAFSLLHSGIVREFITRHDKEYRPYQLSPPIATIPDYKELTAISSIIDRYMISVQGGGKRIRNEEVNTSLKYKNVNTSLRKHHVKKHNNTKTKAIKNVPKHKTIKKYKKKYSNNNTIKRRNRYNR